MKDFLLFLSENQKIIISSAITISELIIIFINMFRRINHRTKTIQLSSSNLVHLNKDNNYYKSIFWKDLRWSINPINLFRKIKY